MKRIGAVVPLAWVLGSCAGSGTPSGDPPPPAVDSSLARLHVYEVPADARAAVRSAQEAAEVPFIEVSGSASVDVAADRAIVAFAVESRAETAADAAGANAELMSAVLAAVRGGGFPGLEIETFGYTLRPEYATPEARVRTIEAYTALNNVRATITDVDRVGAVIDAAIAAGANRISSLSFEASDLDAARGDALAAAVGVARDQARTIAQALGHALGPALEVRGGADSPAPRPYAADYMMMRAEAAPTPIESGNQTVIANVTVRFALGPELPGR